MLYTEYRPRLFADVVGQPAARGLRKMVACGEIPHAMLLTGQRGVGKTTLARIAAMAVNCLSPVNGEPCLRCDACTAPDFVENDSGAYRSLGDVQRLREYMTTSPRWSKQVVIVDEAHALTNQAQTGLLKILEEPPADSIIFLLTTQPEKIDMALKSRCTWWPVKNISVSDLVGLLRRVSTDEGIRISREGAREIAMQAQGSARSALSILESLSAYNEPISKALVKSLLSIIDTSGIISGLLAKDLRLALRESESMAGLYAPDRILHQLSVDLMVMAVEMIESERGADGLYLSRVAAYAARASKEPVVDSLAHLQVVLVEIIDLGVHVIGAVGMSNVWGRFLDSVDGGVFVGMYPMETDLDLSFVTVKRVDESAGKVLFSSRSERAPESVVAAFDLYTDRHYVWKRVEA